MTETNHPPALGVGDPSALAGDNLGENAEGS
jgi:hypothetical protein